MHFYTRGSSDWRGVRASITKDIVQFRFCFKVAKRSIQFDAERLKIHQMLVWLLAFKPPPCSVIESSLFEQ